MKKGKDKEKSNVSPTNYEHTARLRTVDIEKPKKMFNKKRLRPSIKTSPLYRKKYAILALIVLVAFIGAYQLVKVREINFTTLPENISRKIDGEDLERGNALTLRKLYSINDMEYDNFVLFAPKSNMVADEILVVKCKPGQADSVKAKIQNRIESQSNSFKNYAPAQYGIISSSELSKKGDYVYFISAKNTSAINKAIKDSYK